uniref:Uncharacterized protein n=1 Tax=Siphoviridae sp. ctb8j11 TaxID=2825564 RepID=A0A8S5PHK9_9CAUD|nr:MAG TPA: hypothetical protein [Siphoviridae sp. ctb8j11]
MRESERNGNIMENIKLTKEKLLSMRDYVPLAEKMRFVAEAAGGCFDRMELKISGGAESMPMPPMYRDNTSIKSRMLMGAFVKLYLEAGFETEGENPWLMSVADYDRFCGSHIFNQIERMKAEGGEVRDKAFDVLSDWRDLEKRFNTEVYNMMQVMNEPVSRIMMAMQMQTTPEAMQGLKEELESVKKELDSYAAQKKATVKVK